MSLLSRGRNPLPKSRHVRENAAFTGSSDRSARTSACFHHESMWHGSGSQQKLFRWPLNFQTLVDFSRVASFLISFRACWKNIGRTRSGRGLTQVFFSEVCAFSLVDPLGIGVAILRCWGSMQVQSWVCLVTMAPASQRQCRSWLVSFRPHLGMCLWMASPYARWQQLPSFLGREKSLLEKGAFLRVRLRGQPQGERPSPNCRSFNGQHDPQLWEENGTPRGSLRGSSKNL